MTGYQVILFIMNTFYNYVHHWYTYVNTWYNPSNIPLYHICSFISFIKKTSTIQSYNTHTVIPLSKDELRNGCELGLDTWADTCCVGKHAHIDSYVDGKMVSAKGFASTLPTLDNIPIVNASFAYDDGTGRTWLLQVNNAIYLGSHMDHSLLCPNQCEDNDIRIDLRPSFYYPNSPTASTVYCPSHQLSIPVLHRGPLPHIHVRRPTGEEILTCPIIELTSTAEWNPYDHDCLSQNVQQIHHKVISPPVNDDYHPCPISSSLLHLDMYNKLISHVHINYDQPNDTTANISVIATSKKDRITAEELMKIWNIGLATAKRTIKSTTHQCLRTVGTLQRRFRTDKAHMRYKKLSTRHGRFYVDTLFSKVKSIRGYTCGNIFTNTLGFKKFFPLVTESEGKSNMVDFIQLVGIPMAIHSDGAKLFTQGEFRKSCRKYQVPQTFTEPHTPWQNRAEGAIRELKSYASKLMQRKSAPLRLWCFAYEYSAEVLSLCATSHHQLQGRTAYEQVLHYTPDISEYVTFSWYQWAYYWDEIASEKRLCRWLGVAHEIGQAMCYYILKNNAQVLARSTVIPIPNSELDSPDLKDQMTAFTDKVHAIIGDNEKAIVDDKLILDKSNVYNDALYIDDNDDDITYPWERGLEDLPLYDETLETQKDLDEYIGANVVLPNAEGIEVLCRVKSRKRHADGTAIGSRNANPILDTRIFEVEFPDGYTDAFSTNIIAESLYANTDEHGNATGLLDEIIDHQVSSAAIPISKGFTGTDHKPVITTKGWRVKIRWTDQSTDWLTLSQVKNSNPIELAEYAVAKGIEKEPAFNWWVPHTLRKRTRMINKVATRMKKQNMKFGVVMPTTVKEALALDKENGNTYWKDAIAMEYERVKVAFQLIDDGHKIPPTYQKITCHLVFEVKFDLRRKARYVAGGHLTTTPTFLTYSSVVSRESVRIAFLLAALNGLDVWAADIQNAYLNAPTKEKVYFIAGEEWGDHAGKPILVVRAGWNLPKTVSVTSPLLER